MAYKVFFVYNISEGCYSLKDLGEYLKSSRQEIGVSLEEAAEDLEVSVSQLENIEDGNLRAFKDVYKLREDIRQYAKYLGLEPDQVADEFNDFLFEHTSKISLEDILDAKKKQDAKDEEERIRSPYTLEYKKKFNYIPVVIAIVLSLLIALIVYVILSSMNNQPVRDKELMTKINKEALYEYTY